MVNGLMRYVKECSRRGQNGCSKEIKIADEVAMFKKKFPGQRPVVVIDLRNFVSTLIKDHLEVLTAGRTLLHIHRAEDILRKLKELGLDLIFYLQYLSNKSENQKLETRIQKDAGSNKFFEEIEVEDYHRCPLYITWLHFDICAVVRKFGKIKLSTFNDCSTDIGEYALKNHAMAVLSSDSDLLIMPGDYGIWLAENSKFDELVCFKVNKKQLRDKLGLLQKQMPIFATLSGNYHDTIHIRKMFSGRSLEESKSRIAEFIRRHYPKGVPLQTKEFNHLVDIMHNGRTEDVKSVAERVTDSLNMYDYSKMNKNIEVKKSILDHIELNGPSVLLGITLNRSMEVYCQQLDMTLTEFRPYCELVLPLFRRQSGIVHYDNRGQKQQRVYIYKPSSSDGSIKMDLFEHIYPNFDVPPIEDIVDRNSVISMRQKCQILTWLVSPSKCDVSEDLVMTLIDTPLGIPALILNYLYKEDQITCDEADALLLSLHTAHTSPLNKLQSIKPPNTLNPRCIWISYMYKYLFVTCSESLHLAGLSKYVTFSIYDGFIFFKMYNNFKDIDEQKRIELLDPIQKFRIYTNQT